MNAEAEGPDLIDRLAGIAQASPLALLRQQRPDIRAHMQGAYDALVNPPDAGHVSHAERAAIALRVARIERDETFAAHFRAVLDAAGAQDLVAAVEGAAPGNPRLDALLAFADLVTSEPDRADGQEMARLRGFGLDARDIVAVTQLVAFMTYETRVLAGLRILKQEAAR
ncbi:MAG: CMD domain-containing protein [Phreatobacter sp.]